MYIMNFEPIQKFKILICYFYSIPKLNDEYCFIRNTVHNQKNIREPEAVSSIMANLEMAKTFHICNEYENRFAI